MWGFRILSQRIIQAPRVDTTVINLVPLKPEPGVGLFLFIHGLWVVSGLAKWIGCEPVLNSNSLVEVIIR